MSDAEGTFNLSHVGRSKYGSYVGADKKEKEVYEAAIDDGKKVAVVMPKGSGPPPTGEGLYRKYPGKGGMPDKLYPAWAPVPKAWDPKENAKVAAKTWEAGKKMEDTTRQRSIERQVAAKIAAEVLGDCEPNGPDIKAWLDYYKDLVDGVVKVIREDS